MRKFLLDNIREIEASPTLRYYGCALALIHVLTCFFWRNVPSTLAQQDDAVCWPFFEQCRVVRLWFTTTTVGAYLLIYLGMAIASLVLFLWKKTRTGAAYTLLGLATTAKFVLLIQDYRMMGNYHYMPFVSTVAFLVLPGKRIVCRWFLVAHYVSAGLLKMNQEWLSGAALFRPTLLSGRVLEFACAYVVVLELCLVFGLLVKHRGIFWAVFGQLVAFHLFSWNIVGYFYPCVMACLLSILVLDRLLPEDPKIEAMPTQRATLATASLSLGAYLSAQLMPHLFPGDSAITGEGRIFALNMFDARSTCENFMVVHGGVSHVEISEPRSEGLGTRIHCDPIVFMSWAQNACRRNANDGSTIDLFVISKRTTDASYRPLLELRDVCHANLTYDLLRPNSWILK